MPSPCKCRVPPLLAMKTSKPFFEKACFGRSGPGSLICIWETKKSTGNLSAVLVSHKCHNFMGQGRAGIKERHSTSRCQSGTWISYVIVLAWGCRFSEVVADAQNEGCLQHFSTMWPSPRLDMIDISLIFNLHMSLGNKAVLVSHKCHNFTGQGRAGIKERHSMVAESLMLLSWRGAAGIQKSCLMLKTKGGVCNIFPRCGLHQD